MNIEAMVVEKNMPATTTTYTKSPSSNKLFDQLFKSDFSINKDELLSLPNVTFTESFDEDKLAFIVSLGERFDTDVRKTRPNARCQAGQLKKYFLASKKGKINVQYDQADTGLFERYYARCGLSAQGMVREARHTIFHGIYRDIDIKNCHPVIIRWLCRNLNIDCQYLSIYIDHRDKYINELCEHNKDLTYDDIKGLILSINNGGESSYKKLAYKSVFIERYYKELSAIRKKLIDTFPIFKGISDNLKRKQLAKFENFEGSFMSRLCCFIENQLLMRIYYHILEQEEDLSDAILCFDGIMLPTNKVSDALLDELEDKFAELDIPIQLSEKELKPLDLTLYGFNPHAPTIVPEIKVNGYPIPRFQELPTIMDRMKPTCFSDISRLEMMGVHPNLDEIFKFLVENIAYIEDGGKGSFLTKTFDKYGNIVYKRLKTSDLDKNMTMLYYKYKNVKSNGDSEISVECGCLKQFIRMFRNHIKWDHFGFTPYSDFEQINFNDRKLFNTFGGFCHRYDADFIIDDNKISNFLELVREVWAAGDKEIYEAIMKVFACYVQRPEIKTQLCLTVVSGEGCGKNTVTDILTNFVLGSHNAVPVNDMNKITAKFNSSMEGKLLAVLNEASNVGGRDGHKNQDILKDLITEPTIIVERKGFEAYTSDNYCNFIIMSNNDYCIKESTAMRRFALLRASDCKVGNFEFFTEVRKDFMEGKAGVHLYHHLMRLDISKFNPQRDFPVTAAKKEMQQSAIEKPIQWLIELINTQNELLLNSFNSVNSMLIIFNGWLADNYPESSKWNIQRFSKILTGVLGTNVRQRVNGVLTRGYNLNVETTKESISRATRLSELFE